MNTTRAVLSVILMLAWLLSRASAADNWGFVRSNYEVGVVYDGPADNVFQGVTPCEADVYGFFVEWRDNIDNSVELLAPKAGLPFPLPANQSVPYHVARHKYLKPGSYRAHITYLLHCTHTRDTGTDAKDFAITALPRAPVGGLSTDLRQYAPGQTVQLTVFATSQQKAPASGIRVYLQVTAGASAIDSSMGVPAFVDIEPGATEAKVSFRIRRPLSSLTTVRIQGTAANQKHVSFVVKPSILKQ
jgi:hypothetical protein